MLPRHSESEGFKKASSDIAKLLKSSKKLPTLSSKGTNSVPAWFLGTKAENADELERLIVEAIRDHAYWRRNFHPEDPTHITEKIKMQPEFLEAMAALKENYWELLAFLKKSVPFFSMRYQGHMIWDVTMPAILGYFATMLYNPNNVAFEASTATTYLEILVGNDLCQMLGYTVPDAEALAAGAIPPWGHITCGGTVANIEAVWSARNLKLYPIALQQALQHEESLAAARDLKIFVPELQDEKKLISLNTWQLLNLKSDDILALSSSLEKEYGITGDTVTAALSKYSVQDIGMVSFARKYLKEIEHLPILLVPGTKHYSWPKAAAVLGIGNEYEIDVPIDKDARMDTEALRKKLQACLDNKQAVYTVVAVIGSTEESSVDPLKEILAIRSEFSKKGLEFTLHADAAWGGYHATVIRSDFDLVLPTATKQPQQQSSSQEMPPMLSQYVQSQLEALADTDSITVDPHKSGYIPYPAGALCYRNSAMRDLVTFKAPVIFSGKAEPTIGIYGIEGSKPGAAPASVYLSHKVIRPSKSGYGKIINQALYGCKKLYARLLCMESDKFIVVPVPRLPAEIAGQSEYKVSEQRELIGEKIDGKTYDEIAQDPQAMELLVEIGADQNILAYAFNLKNPDGRINTDLNLANQLNKDLYNMLSIEAGDDIYSYDLIVSTTDFKSEQYGRVFMEDYARRLGVKVPQEREFSITVLRSVVLDPWVTETTKGSFIDTIEAELRKAVSQAMLQGVVWDVYKEIDVNQDNVLSKEEIENVLRSKGCKKDEIKRFWDISDVDKDGTISKNEFLRSFPLWVELTSGS